MGKKIQRRKWMGAAGMAAVTGMVGHKAFGQESEEKLKIVGINCSPRKEMTTSASLKVCLEAAKKKNPDLETELIELGEYSIPPQVAAGLPLKEGEKDDFPKIVEKLEDPSVAGIVIGSPVYFNNMTALCKAFLDRCIVFRRNDFSLRNKVAGVLAIGGVRNGGQEITIQSIQASLTGQDVVLVGSGKPTGRIGATLWNQGKIENDEFGTRTAENLGARIAEMVELIKR